MVGSDQILELYCPDCGYDLRQLQSDRCPECGLAIDRSVIGQSIIPWVHREKIGRYRAFWKTVTLVTFRTRQLAVDMNVPSHLADARSFRRLAVLHAVLATAFPLTIIVIGGSLFDSQHLLWSNKDFAGSLFQLVSLIAGWACLAAFFMIGSGVAGYFFSPAELTPQRQNRALILSLYTAAPVAWLPVTLVLASGLTFVAAITVDHHPNSMLLGLMFITAYLPLLLQLVALIRTPVILLGAITHRTGRQWALGLTLPGAWLLLAIILLVVVPMAWLYLGVLLLSFRH